jgi:UDP-glucose 4-epimerase
VSTVDVYGQPDRRLIGESHRTRPGSYYGVSKLAGEGLVRVFAQRRGIPHAVLRLAQVYGPGDVSRKAIPAFVRAGLTSREITVHGPGTEQRSYLFVDDAVDACIAALDKRADGVFNVAGRPVSVLQVAQLTRRLLCLKRPVRRLRGKPRPSLALDAEAAHRVLGFRARTRLDQGLRSVIKELSAV